MGLLGWLNAKAQTLTAVHKPECARRGIGGPGAKGALSDAADYEACPVGYSGDLPTEASLCCCCREDGCVAKAAAAAEEAAAAAVATAEAEATEKAAAEA